ncbi:MAG: hypothetical protein FWC09_04595 [Lachnospiraceae bacterium]|nr:hypothetical protein [Lachnospiraceae bacterium]
MNHDWNKCKNEKEKIMEGFYQEALDANGNLQTIAFDMGLMAGFALGLELQPPKVS